MITLILTVIQSDNSHHAAIGVDDEGTSFRIIDPVIMHIDIVECRSGSFAVDADDGDDFERCSDGWNRSSWDQPWRAG